MLPFEGTVLLVGRFLGLRRPEVQAAKKGAVSVGLARFDARLCVIGLRIPGLISGWTDLPFALGVERAENRRFGPPDAVGRMRLVRVMGDRLTGVARVVRPLSMSRAWTVAFHGVLEAQHDAGDLSRAEYDALVRATRGRWPGIFWRSSGSGGRRSAGCPGAARAAHVVLLVGEGLAL